MIKVFTEGIRRRLRILWEKAIWPLIKMNYSISKGFYIRYPEVSKHEKIDLSTVGYMDEYSEEILDYFSFKGLEMKIKSKFSYCNNDTIKVESQKNDGENWLVSIFNPEAKNLMIEFDFSINQIVHEFQLAFNYKGIKERNRFLIIENTKVLFDCIKKGSFFPILFEKSFDYIFSADIINHVKLIVDSGVYSLYVNGKCLLSITEKIKICKGDSLALILWEDSHNRPISCEISNIQLSKIA